MASYQFALNALDLPLLEARTVATTVLVLVGLYLIFVLEGAHGRRGRLVARHVRRSRRRLCRALALAPTRAFFELAMSSLEIVATSAVGALIAIAGLEVMGLRREERQTNP